MSYRPYFGDGFHRCPYRIVGRSDERDSFQTVTQEPKPILDNMLNHQWIPRLLCFDHVVHAIRRGFIHL
jgi:hypothetical protein